MCAPKLHQAMVGLVLAAAATALPLLTAFSVTQLFAMLLSYDAVNPAVWQAQLVDGYWTPPQRLIANLEHNMFVFASVPRGQTLAFRSNPPTPGPPNVPVAPTPAPPVTPKTPEELRAMANAKYTEQSEQELGSEGWRDYAGCIIKSS